MSDAAVHGVQLPFLPIGGVEGLRQRPPVELPPERSFDTVLQKELNGITFSKHAQERLNACETKLNDDDLAKIRNAVDLAGQKGSNESLVLLKEMAFIVSVPNRTVITAIANGRLRDNVFTNIDSAVIAA